MVTTVRVFLLLMLCLMARSLIRTALLRRSRTFVATKAAVADNAGIRRLPSVHPSLLALWKVSNVAIFEGTTLHRAASEPVSVWLKQNQHQHSNNIPTILFPSTLAATISGIVLVAESNINVARLTRVVYVGVLACPVADAVLLQEKLQLSITNALNNNHDKKRQKETVAVTSTDHHPRSVSDLEVEVDVEVVQSSESGTHNGLHLVRVSLIGSPIITLSSPIPPQVSGPPVSSHSQQDDTSIVERLLVGCAVAKAPCVMDGKTPLLSLVNIEAQIESTTHTHSNNNDQPNPLIGSSASPGPSPRPSLGPVTVSVTQEVPVKFTKYMRRENILHSRLTTSHSQGQQDDATTTTADPTATSTTNTSANATAAESTTAATEATFMGLSLVVPADALRPRPSSAILVEHALIKLAALREGIYSNNPSLPLRVLDLGTGSGALLLSLLHRAQNTPQDGKEVAVGGLGRVVGVGVDIDQSALSAASGNAARASLTGVCRWACHDFAQLADERVRQDLASAVSACEESAQSNDHTAPVKSSMDDSVAQSNDHTAPVKEREGIFDVILCNPPYLSAPSVRGRVTNEGRGVLVADDKGMQAYKDICRAVALANLPVKTAQSNDRTAPVKMSIDDSVAQSNGFTVPVKSSAAQLNVSASSLPLLAPHGCIIFQAPGGANGWRAVKRAVESEQGLGQQQGQGLGSDQGLVPGRGKGKGKGPVSTSPSFSSPINRPVWRVTEVVEDERGVKRCVVVQQQPQ